MPKSKPKLKNQLLLVLCISVMSALFGAITNSVNAIGSVSSSVTAPINGSCPAQIPTLINGSFEDFSNPAEDPNVLSGLEGGSVYGKWHGYADGPDQILLLKPSATAGAGQTANYLTGWKSTTTLLELQRQVPTYTDRHNASGALVTPSLNSPALGNATTTTISSNPSDYFDKYAPQAAEGDYWAELNPTAPSALYQDITVPSAAQVFWSIKHRGRTDSNPNEEMKVLIGPVVNNVASLTQQTSIQKYSPTNVNVYVGAPTYGSNSTSVSQILGTLSGGWNRFEGTYPADNSQGAQASRILRLQFESIRGGNGWATFGNLLDDIQFSALLACPVTKSLQVGQTATIDVTGQFGASQTEKVSYGVRQSLSALGNSNAPSSQFATSGNTVSFTPAQAGTFSVDYQVSMDFGGQTYSAASTINYVVSADPNATPTASPSSNSSSSPLAVNQAATPVTTLAETGIEVMDWLLLAFTLLMLGLTIFLSLRKKYS